MTARRRRPTLRAAIALALVGSTIAVSVLVTGVVVLTAGRIVYESRQQGLLDEFSTTADALFTSISTGSPEDTWKYYAEILPGETVIIDLDSGRSAGELRPDQVPDALAIDDDTRRSGDLTSLMTTLEGRDVFFVSVVRDDLPQDPSARLAVVTAYSMEPQREQVRELVISGALLSGGVVVLVVLLERLLGGALTRPLRRLVDTAQAVGSGEGPPAWKPSFDDVDRVADALRLSSEQLGSTIAQLQRREAESRRLVSDVAHELRTPLTSMMAVDELLDDDEQTTAEERAVAAAVVRTGTRRLHSLIEHLLELSRLDAGVARVHRTTVSLPDLLDDVIDATGVDHVEVSVSPISASTPTPPGCTPWWRTCSRTPPGTGDHPSPSGCTKTGTRCTSTSATRAPASPRPTRSGCSTASSPPTVRAPTGWERGSVSRSPATTHGSSAETSHSWSGLPGRRSV